MKNNELWVRTCAEELLQNVVQASDNVSRMFSKSFWDVFGYKKRTSQRVKYVWQALTRCGLSINLTKDEFGKEKPKYWIVLSYQQSDPPPFHDKVQYPESAWFKKISELTFESEPEVESCFALELFAQLGYENDDIYLEYPIKKPDGSKKNTFHTDIALFDGTIHTDNNILLLVECKRSKNSPGIIPASAVAQARSYTEWLKAPGYMLTNGEKIQVFHRDGSGRQSDRLVVDICRNHLASEWEKLYKVASKKAMQMWKKKVIRNGAFDD